MLIANGCELNHLKSEFHIVYNHMIKFLKNSSVMMLATAVHIERWSCLKNKLHIVELCVAIPLSKAESERVFS